MSYVNEILSYYGDMWIITILVYCKNNIMYQYKPYLEDAYFHDYMMMDHMMMDMMAMIQTSKLMNIITV